MDEKHLRALVQTYERTREMHDAAEIIAYLIKYFDRIVAPPKIKAPTPYAKPVNAPIVPASSFILTRGAYDGVVHASKVEDLKPVQIAGDFGFPLQHINYAILSTSYENYLHHAKRIK